MNNIKTYKHGLPWEDEHGITQGYCVNGTIYISGQFSHDMQGTFVGHGDIEVQYSRPLVGVPAMAFPDQLIEIPAVAHIS